MIRRFAILILSLAASATAIAQSTTLTQSESYGLVKTNIGVEYDYTGGAMSNHFSGRLSYEFLNKKNFTLTANTAFNSLECDFSEKSISYDANPAEIGINKTHYSGQTGLTGTYRTHLFGKPFMGFAMASLDWGDGGLRRFQAMAMGLFMLHVSPTTQFGIGPLVLINSTSKVPAFLVFIYRHKFSNTLALNLYGGMFGLDYTPTANDTFTAGADIAVRFFYFRPQREDLPERCRFTSTSFRPCIKYRRRIAGRLFGELQGGAAIKMSARVNAVNGTKEYIKFSQRPKPFVQASLTYSL